MAQKRKKSKKWAYWVIMLILFVAAGVVVYLVWDNYFNDEKRATREPEKVQEIDKKKKLENGEDNGEEDNEAERVMERKKVEQYDGEDPNQAEELSGVVTYAGVNSANLTIRVNIDQYLDNGQCELSLVRDGGSVYNSTALVVGNASTATCEGFDVPVSGLSGKYEIVVKLNSSDKSGVIRGEVDV